MRDGTFCFCHSYFVSFAHRVVVTSDWHHQRRGERAGGFHVHVWSERPLEVLQSRSGELLFPAIFAPPASCLCIGVAFVFLLAVNLGWQSWSAEWDASVRAKLRSYSAMGAV